MKFEQLDLPFGIRGYGARKGDFSFLVTEKEDGQWLTSWQDQVKGGSASSNIEGPFKTRHQAEAHCRRMARELGV